MIPVLLATISYLGWGIADVLGVSLYRNNKAESITVMSGLARIFIWSLMIPFFIGDISRITTVPLIFNLIAGFGSGIGSYFYGKSCRTVNPVLVTTISGVWGVPALLLSILFLNESISREQGISVILVILGLLVIVFDILLKFRGKLINDFNIIYAFLSLLSWGVCGTFLKIPALEYGWFWTSLIMLFPYITIIFFSKFNSNEKFQPKINNKKLFLLVVFLIILADFGYNSSFSYGGSVIVAATIAGSYSTLSSLLSYLLYREKLNTIQVIGTIFTLVGIVFVSYFTATG